MLVENYSSAAWQATSYFREESAGSIDTSPQTVDRGMGTNSRITYVGYFVTLLFTAYQQESDRLQYEVGEARIQDKCRKHNSGRDTAMLEVSEVNFSVNITSRIVKILSNFIGGC